MSEEMLIRIGQNAVMVALEVGGPLLLLGLVAGVTVSVLQAVTQIQEATLSFIPKILAVALAFLLFTPWMIQKLVQFTTFLFGDFRVFIQ
ncbi:MAG: flagellar biosynthesis protein FliQ [Candidatus Eisenbacteria sp.]|nr:flagellar biosynthesis protein FliQ [Candidatus Eisenbacteria bacterium]